jgi:branched-chain amino acid transport system substrate-binding protein
MFYLTRIAGAIIVREDGRMVHDYYVFRVKKPSESKSPWDLYALEATLPGDQAFREISAKLCPKLGN